MNRFQSNLFYILHDIPICLSSPFFVNLFFFNAVFCVCSFLVFFSQPDVVNITSCTSDTSIVDKIDQKNFGAGHLSKLIGCLRNFFKPFCANYFSLLRKIFIDLLRKVLSVILF